MAFRQNVSTPIPPAAPFRPNRSGGAPRRNTGATLAAPDGAGGWGVLIQGGVIPQRGEVNTHLLPMPDYRGFTYQGEQPVPMTQPGPAAQAAAFQAVREVVGPASIEHATVMDRIANTVYANLASEQMIAAPDRTPYADPIAVAASPGYIPAAAKRPRQMSPARQKQLIYPGAWNPYAMQVRAPTFEDVRQFFNAGPAPVRGAFGR